ncbi:MAG: hypothetical protein KDD55_10220 [Bdellovibrionales bacterium]|nr:hypothetical protein [Bdellovibrionales bacterium]
MNQSKEALKIGLLLDSLTAPSWVAEIITLLQASDFAKIELLVLNTNPGPYADSSQRLLKNLHKLVYFAYTTLDRKFFPNKPDPFEERNLSELLAEVPQLKIVPERGKFTDTFLERDLQEIQSYELDVLYRAGFRILNGDILSAAKHGVWSFHHGNSENHRGGPACFWEAVEDWPETCVTLQKLDSKLDAGQVISKSFGGVYPYSPNRNKGSIFWKSVALLPRALQELHEQGQQEFEKRIQNFNRDVSFYDQRLYRAPGNLQALGIVCRQLLKIVKRALLKLWYVDQWFLMFRFDRDGLSTEIHRFHRLFPPKDRIWADPHILWKDNKHHVFLEELEFKKSKGTISHFTLNTDGKMTPATKILERDYHLSYPFIFEFNTNLYMVPESFQSRRIELYECAEFPDRWEFRSNVMEDICATDTTIFQHGERWWLFTTIAEREGMNCQDELFIFYAESPLSQNWIPHAQNPVVSDVKRGRSAGRILEQNGKYYRPAQDGSFHYGRAIRFYEIVTLTTQEYSERFVTVIAPNWDKRVLATHSISYDNNLTMIDAYTRRPRFF